MFVRGICQKILIENMDKFVQPYSLQRK